MNRNFILNSLFIFSFLEAAMLNSSVLEKKRNYSNAHSTLLYYSVTKRIDVRVVILEVIFLFLIFVFVSLGVYLYHWFYSNPQPHKQYPKKISFVTALSV